MAHYTYLNFIPDDKFLNYQKLTLAVVVGGTLLVLGRKAMTRLSAPGGEHALLVPEEKMSLFGFFDLLLDGFVRFQDSILGKENRRYLPLCGSLFLFVFFSNLLGLIPGVAAITTSVWINVGLAVVVFCAFNAYGVREHGLGGYLKHFCGPIIFLAPFVFCVEILSTVLRILTLNLRLYWNITADHLVLEQFTNLTGYIIPSLFYAMGTFVAFMQAFVFTILTMIYILLATQHEEEHH